MAILIICLVLLAASNVYTLWVVYNQRKALEASQAETGAERQKLVEYKNKCYCKEVLP